MLHNSYTHRGGLSTQYAMYDSENVGQSDVLSLVGADWAMRVLFSSAAVRWRLDGSPHRQRANTHLCPYSLYLSLWSDAGVERLKPGLHPTQRTKRMHTAHILASWLLRRLRDFLFAYFVALLTHFFASLRAYLHVKQKLRTKVN